MPGRLLNLNCPFTNGQTLIQKPLPHGPKCQKSLDNTYFNDPPSRVPSIDFLNLPVELVQETVQYLTTDDLKTLQLTCSALRRIVKPYLWEHLDINTSLRIVNSDPTPRFKYIGKHLGNDCSQVCFPHCLYCHHNCKKHYISVNAENIQEVMDHYLLVGLPLDQIRVLSFHIDEYTSPELLSPNQDEKEDPYSSSFARFINSITNSPELFPRLKLIEITSGPAYMPWNVVTRLTSVLAGSFGNHIKLNIEASPFEISTNVSDLFSYPKSNTLKLFSGDCEENRRRFEELMNTTTLPQSVRTLFLHYEHFSPMIIDNETLKQFLSNASSLKVVSLKGMKTSQSNLTWVPDTVEAISLDNNYSLNHEESDNNKIKPGIVTPPALFAHLSLPAVTLSNVQYLRLINPPYMPNFPKLPQLEKLVISGSGSVHALEVLKDNFSKTKPPLKQLTCKYMSYRMIGEFVDIFPSLSSLVVEEAIDEELDWMIDLINKKSIENGLHFAHLSISNLCPSNIDIIEQYLMESRLINSIGLLRRHTRLLIDTPLSSSRLYENLPVFDGYSRSSLHFTPYIIL